MTTTNHLQLPYLDITGLDGNKLYTLNERSERFRYYIKRINNIDNKQFPTGETTPTGER